MDAIHEATVDPQGRLILPAGLAGSAGLEPGSEVSLRVTHEGLLIRPPLSQLRKVYIEPTSCCNLSCHMCIRNSWDEAPAHMGPATFERLLESLRQLDHKPVIILGGFGEPLFHPDIVEMVASLMQVGARVEIITNGLLLTEAMMERFIHLRLDVLWFSVDSLHADANGKPSNLLPKMRQLHHVQGMLHSRTPETGLAFVATRANLQELPDLVRGAVSYGIARYMVTNLLPYSEDVCDQTLYSRTLDQMQSRPSYWSPIIQLPRMDWNEDTREALYQVLHSGQNVRLRSFGLGMAEGQCPFVEAGAVAVSSTGAVSPCLALVHSHVSYLQNAPRVVSRHVIGNINDATLTDLWKDAAYLAFRKRVDMFDFSPCTLCGGCEMAEANQEDCFGNTFPTCGGCLWAWGVIQCP